MHTHIHTSPHMHTITFLLQTALLSVYLKSQCLSIYKRDARKAKKLTPQEFLESLCSSSLLWLVTSRNPQVFLCDPEFDNLFLASRQHRKDRWQEQWVFHPGPTRQAHKGKNGGNGFCLAEWVTAEFSKEMWPLTCTSFSQLWGLTP
jgi:hypothetical protein